MSRPDWKDAPEWARWMAQDWNGGWFWYENKPELGTNYGEWLWEGRYERALGIRCWRETLEERPIGRSFILKDAHDPIIQCKVQLGEIQE